jgi:protein-disulfide isomerase
MYIKIVEKAIIYKGFPMFIVYHFLAFFQNGLVCYNKRMTNDKSISPGAAIIVAGIIIAGAIIFTRGGGNSSVASSTTLPKIEPSTYTTKPTASEDHLLGSSTAPIVITVYSDLECPFCKSVHPTLHKLVDDYKGQVALKFVHFPLSIHPKAQKEAQAAECAYKQGGNVAFWNYIDIVFQVTESNNKLDAALLPQIAKKVGLKEKAFMECLDSDETKSIVDADTELGNQAGVRGTPHSIIKKITTGESIAVPGAAPYENFKSKIDDLISGKITPTTPATNPS